MDRALAKLYGATFLYSLAQGVGLPLVSEYLEIEHAAPLGFIGFALGIYGVMQVVLRLPMGDMADRRGRKPSLLLAFACAFAAGVLLVLGRGAWWTVPALALFGFAGGIYWVAANAYLFDHVSRAGGDVAKATTDYSMALGLAFLVGPPFGHVVAEHFGFRAAFATFLWTSALAALLVLSLPEEARAPRPRPEGGPYRRALRLLRHPALVASAAGTFLYSSLFATLTSFFQLHALAAGVGLVAIGLLLGERQAAALLVRVGLPAALRRFGARRALFAAIFVFAGAVALVPLATDVWTMAAVIAVAGAATGVLIPANLMLVHEGAPPDERGLANGIYGTMLGVGSAAAPLAYGALGERLGLAWTFWAAALVAGLLALALAWWLAR